MVQLTRGRRIFCSICVKPWVASHIRTRRKETREEDDEDDEDVSETEKANMATEALDEKQGPRKFNVKRGFPDERSFAESHKDELDGFIREGTFKVTKEAKLDQSVRIFGSRFVDEIKNVGERLKRKPRLVA